MKKRHVRIEINLTPEEAEVLRRIADTEGLQTATYVRLMAVKAANIAASVA